MVSLLGLEAEEIAGQVARDAGQARLADIHAATLALSGALHDLDTTRAAYRGHSSPERLETYTQYHEEAVARLDLLMGLVAGQAEQDARLGRLRLAVTAAGPGLAEPSLPGDIDTALRLAADIAAEEDRQWPALRQDIDMAGDRARHRGWMALFLGLALIFAGAGTALALAAGASRRIRTAGQDAQSSLRRAEQRYRLFFENVAVGTTEMTLDGYFLRANRRFCDFVGYEEAALRGMTVAQLTHPEDRERERPLMRAFMREETPTLKIEKRLIRKDGEAVWVQVTASLARDDEGRPLHAVGIVEDIGARKQAELALRENEERLRLLIETVPAGIAMFDRAMRYITVSSRFAEEYRLPRQDLVGHDHYDIFPEIPERWREIHRRCLSGASERGTNEPFPRADGTLDWVDWEIRPWRDGNGAIGGLVLVSQLVTKRRQTEESLRESEARYRAFFDNAVVGATELSVENKFLNANDYFCRMVGYSLGELRCLGADDLLHPEDRARCLAEVKAHLAGTPAVWKSSRRYLRKTGEVIWVEIGATLAHGLDGKPLRSLAVVQDVTQRHRYEEQLSRAKTEAEHANLAKSKFLAAASHDLRQPVQSLVLLLEVLRRRAGDGPIAPLAATMESAVTTLSLLLNGILDISRLDADVVTPKFADMALGPLLTALTGEYQARAVAKGIALKAMPTRLAVRSDPLLLERVLRNLIENAIRYTPKGRIVIGARRRDRMVRIDVLDTGIGIPREQFRAIFEEFHQLGNLSRDRNQGLGLGLAIVKRMVGLLEGEVEVDSRLGTGSCFSVMLPLAAAPPAEGAPAGPEARGAGRSVLVVEDEPTVRLSLAVMLEEWGFTVLSAATGEEALALAETPDADIAAIVTDFMMDGGMDGAQTVEAIRAGLGWPVPALILTGDTQPARLRMLHANDVRIIHKPVSSPELRQAISEILAASPRPDRAG